MTAGQGTVLDAGQFYLSDKRIINFDFLSAEPPQRFPSRASDLWIMTFSINSLNRVGVSSAKPLHLRTTFINYPMSVKAHLAEQHTCPSQTTGSATFQTIQKT